MKNWLALVALPALLAAAPVSLVVGSVRDQFGAPIKNAQVSGAGERTVTDAAGTFALRADGVRSLSITCAYCANVTTPVNGDEPVVIFLQRYDALAHESPTDSDLASVPYGQAASAVSLRPFAVLSESSNALPGQRVSDWASSSHGALLLDDGIPSYDIVTNISGFDLLPAYDVQRVAWHSPAEAFLYGDLAGGGTVAVDTHPLGSASDLALMGGGDALRASGQRNDAAWSVATARSATNEGNRADLALQVPLAGDALTFQAQTANDRFAPSLASLDTSANGARLDYERGGETHLQASLVTDAGAYDVHTGITSYAARWSDLQAQGGFETSTRIALFGDAAVRASSGSYAGQNGTLPLVAGTISQTQIALGAQTSGDSYLLRAGIGAFGIHANGGASLPSHPLDAAILTPSFTGSYDFDPHWSIGVQASQSFALPTLLEAYANTPEGIDLPFDRNTTIAQTLTYGDLRRLRASLLATSEGVSGLDNGTVHAQGASVAWQLAPRIALRAWLLHESDTTQPYENLDRLGARPQPATVGSYWLTYQGNGFRIDAIYRRDLLDYRPNPHLDASLTAPLDGEFALYAASQRQQGVRSVIAGIRFEAP